MNVTRRASFALAGSVGLHALLISALLTVRVPAPAPGTSAPTIIEVDLVRLAGEAEGRGRVPQAEAVSEEPAPAQRDRAQAVPAEVPAADPPVLADALSELETEPEPLDSAPDVPEAAPEDAVAATEPSGPEAASVPIEEPSPEPTILTHDTPPTASAIAPGPEPETVEIPPAQRRMLDRKLADWSAELDEMDESTLSWTHRGREYTAEFSRSATDDSVGLEHVIVAISTEQAGSRWSTEVQLKRLAFSSFAQFVDRWDPNVQIHDDEIDGRFHSNSEIYIARSGGVQPAFLGKVTTAKRINTSQSTRPIRRDEVFLGGLETRVSRIVLPRRFVPFASSDGTEPERLQRFDVDSRITFAADGSYVWQPVDAPAQPQWAALSEDPHYLIADDGVSLYVSGIVNGKVLIHSPEDLVIEGDLVYAAHPADEPGSDDFLGLVAEKRVVIADPQTTGPGDLTVHAAIYAKRRFTVARYRTDGPATLRIFGSVAAGSLSATEPRFRTQLTFDPRLEDARPPRFPLTDRYELTTWDGLWTAEQPR